MLKRNRRALPEVLIRRARLIAQAQRVRTVQRRRRVRGVHRAVDVDYALHAPAAEDERPPRQPRVHVHLVSGERVLPETRVGHVVQE